MTMKSPEIKGKLSKPDKNSKIKIVERKLLTKER